MFQEEKFDYILKKLKKNSRVSVSDLSYELDVSEVTIRKYLTELEEKGLLKRTFGGAILPDKLVKEKNFFSKNTTNVKEKIDISKKAHLLLEDNQDIFLDAGTTTQYIVDVISHYNNMKIITYDINIAIKASSYKNIEVYLLGGIVDSNSMISMSIDAYEMLKNLHADICFIGTDAFDKNYVYSTNHLKSKIKNSMIKNSKIRVLVSDSSKYEKRGLISFYETKNFDYILTDKKNKDLINYIQKLEEEDG
ncbi:MAG: DeoR/GlpR family DNA-binding transcription regulator [Tissierellia bacterium]|nr:DeoR/GlpR family DNA-binding transcription regulator [Tissierellia bacterium]